MKWLRRLWWKLAEKFSTDTEAWAMKQGCPPALAKATVDYFTYACGLRDGTIVVFEEAAIVSRGWVRLNVIGYLLFNRGPLTRLKDEGDFTFDRGLEVRMSDIMWVADAPWGS